MSGISLMLIGSKSTAIRLTNRTIVSLDYVLGGVGEASPWAGIILGSNGIAYESARNSGIITDTPIANEWGRGANGASYEVRFTVQSGGTGDIHGTLNQWLALSSDRTVAVYTNRTQLGEETVAQSFLVEIRRAAGTVLASAIITLEARAIREV